MIGVQAENIWIAGEDRAGWTLDDYVMPRLNSGLIYGNEVGLGEVPVAFRDLNPEYPDAEEPGG